MFYIFFFHLDDKKKHPLGQQQPSVFCGKLANNRKDGLYEGESSKSSKEPDTELKL